MRKVKILSAAFLAVLAFGVVSAANAVAAPEWLESGNKITTAQSAVTEGKWTMNGKGIFGITVEVECNGKLIGTVGPGAADSVTKVTDLSGNSPLDCTILKQSIKVCTGTLALVSAVNLPWKTELLLVTSTEIVDHFFEGTNGSGLLPGFNVQCILSGGTFTSEICEGNVLTAALVNNATSVSGKVVNSKSSKCSGGGSNEATVNASGETKLLSGNSLQVHD